MLLLLILLSLTVSSVSGTSITVDDCPPGLARDKSLKVFDDKCYRFEKVEKLDFESAQKKCQINGGSLAMIKSNAQDEFVIKELENSVDDNLPFWIGLRYNTDDKTYHYVDGYSMEYNRLTDIDLYNPENHCVSILWEYTYWFNYLCSKNDSSSFEALNYICEYPTEPDYDCPGALPRDNLHVYENYYYEFNLHKMLEFDYAEKYCQKCGGDLALVKNSGIEEFLKSKIDDTYSDYLQTKFWIGLRFNHGNNEYTWRDGTLLDFDHINYKYTQHFECFTIADVSSKWIDVNCKHDQPFICQYPVKQNLTIDNCPENVPRNNRLKIFEEKCYSFETDKEYTFDDAEAFCEKNEGELAMIESKITNEFIYVELNKLTSSIAWIGALYSYPDSSYKYVNGSAVDYQTGVKPYLKLNVDDYNGCVAIQPSNGLWDLANCDYQDAFGFKENRHLPFVCQYNTSPFKFKPSNTTTTTTKTTAATTAMTTTTPTTTTITISKQDCPVMQDADALIQVLGDKCYYFNIEYKLTYKRAITFCQTRGGKLVNAETKDLQNFLIDHLKNTYKMHYGYYWIAEGPRSERRQDNECLAIDLSAGYSKTYDCGYSKAIEELPENFICEFEGVPIKNTPKSTTRHPTTTKQSSTTKSTTKQLKTTNQTTPTKSTTTKQPITTKSTTTKQPITTKITTTKETIATKSSTTKQPTPKKSTTKQPITTKSTTKQPKTTTHSTTRAPCNEIYCELDCGLEGYKIDPVTKCAICECDY